MYGPVTSRPKHFSDGNQRGDHGDYSEVWTCCCGYGSGFACWPCSFDNVYIIQQRGFLHIHRVERDGRYTVVSRGYLDVYDGETGLEAFSAWSEGEVSGSIVFAIALALWCYLVYTLVSYVRYIGIREWAGGPE